MDKTDRMVIKGNKMMEKGYEIKEDGYDYMKQGNEYHKEGAGSFIRYLELGDETDQIELLNICAEKEIICCVK